MRWVLVKLVNLFVVLVIVTFIVAAIFSGPMAQQQRQLIIENVNNQMIQYFKGKTADQVARDCMVSVAKREWIKTNMTNIAKSIIYNNSEVKPLLSNLSSEQKAELEILLINSITDTLNNSKIIGKDAFVKYASAILYREAQAKGIPINMTVAKKLVSLYYDSMSKVCKAMIKDYRIYTQIARLGLNRPWYLIAISYTKMLLTFKPLYATSLTTQYWPYQGDRNVYHIILERLPYSVALFTTSSILTLLFAMPLALYGARRPGGAVDNTITVWSIFSVSMPWWWLAMVLIYLLTAKYHIFPSPYQTKGINWRNPIQVAKMAALPVLTVTVLSIGDTSYRIRNILLDIFNEDFVTVARAKGVPERIVLGRHVMRAAAPPLVTIVLFSIVMSVFSGAIITELVFNWFGLGRLYWDAIEANDIPVLVALTYFTTLLYLIIRFVLDIVYTILDPRIRRA